MPSILARQQEAPTSPAPPQKMSRIDITSPFSKTVRATGSNIFVLRRITENTFYPAGHLAGAALIYLQGEEGSLLYTGDLSVTRQQTVNGAFIPRLRPDVMITETTYGDKLHANREIEEGRLVEMVKKVTAGGGKVLFPAFALGRAQEIILILKKAVAKKEMPPVKIYVDGMIRDVNRIYELNPNYLRENLAKKIFRGNRIFYDGHVAPVEDEAVRDAVLRSNESLCVIASSGMLTGGYSPRYAENFAAGEKNYIAVTGYQDEEAPGRKLLNLVGEEEKFLELNEKTIPVKCGVGVYGLSAHADKGELQAVIHKLAPRRLFLVHGEEEIIDGFARGLGADLRAQIYVPVNGDEYECRLKKPRKQVFFIKNLPPLRRPERLTTENIKDLWEHVIKEPGPENLFSIEDLYYLWHGRADCPEDESKNLQELLNTSAYFTPDPRRLFLYRPVPEEQAAEEPEIMEMNSMLALARELFPPEAGLYKKGARQEEKTALLYFNFPARVTQDYAGLLQEFTEKTGWRVEVHPEFNHMAAEELVYTLLNGAAAVNKFSYYRPEGMVVIDVDREIANLEEIKRKFTVLTGLRLEVGRPGASPATPALKPVDETMMMEQNKAFALIDRYFKETERRIYKKSKKISGGIPYLELSFITPEVGRRYQDLLAKVEGLTGWNLVVGKNPNLNEIIKKAREICRSAGISLTQNPSIFSDRGTVRIKIPPEAAAAGREKIKEIKEEFREETGYELEFDD